jgi:hypothetical protein
MRTHFDGRCLESASGVLDFGNNRMHGYVSSGCSCMLPLGYILAPPTVYPITTWIILSVSKVESYMGHVMTDHEGFVMAASQQ